MTWNRKLELFKKKKKQSALNIQDHIMQPFPRGL